MSQKTLKKHGMILPSNNTKTIFFDKTNKIINNNWSKLADSTLRWVYNQRKKKGKIIEDSLNEELAKRFPGYNPETKNFGKHNNRKPKKTDWSKSSNESLRGIYKYRQKKRLPIEDSLNEELAKRFSWYNKETKTFGRCNKRTKETDWHKASNDSLRSSYNYRQEHQIPIEDPLNEELAKRFTWYNKETKTFGKCDKRLKRTDWTKSSNESLRVSYNHKRRKNIPIESSLNEELAKRFKNYDLETQTFVKKKDLVKTAALQTNIDSKKLLPTANTLEKLQQQKIVVEIKPTKMTLEGTYNDVFVNGRKLLKNHINTEVQLFCEDTILGIHGIISDNKYYPTSPIWLIYDTNIKQRPSEQKNIITKYNILVKKIYNYEKEIRLELDNKAIIILDNEKMKKIAKLRRFVLDKQK